MYVQEVQKVHLVFILMQVVTMSFPCWLGCSLTVFLDWLTIKESCKRNEGKGGWLAAAGHQIPGMSLCGTGAGTLCKRKFITR